MADWKKLAHASLMADGKIDDAEVKLLKKELIDDDGKVDNEEMAFLIELHTAASRKAKAANAPLNPKFEKLFYDAVKLHVLGSGKSITDAKAEKLEAILGKPDDAKKKFVASLKKAATGGAKFNSLAAKFGAK
jgi:hypothetical protein